MYKRFLLCLFLGLFCWCSCAHFGPGQKEGVYPEEVMDLLMDLNKISYWPYRFVEHEFDCSNMAALLYDLLTDRGYKCQLVIGLNILKFFKSAHVWLIVEHKGKEFLVDAVSKAVVKKSFFIKYVFRKKFSSLKELRQCHIKHSGNPNEWEYPKELFLQK